MKNIKAVNPYAAPVTAEEHCEREWKARGFKSAQDMDNWLWAGQPDRVNYSSGRPGPDASKDEWDNWLYSGGGR